MIMRRVRNAALVCGMGAARIWIVSTTGILKMTRMRANEDGRKYGEEKEELDQVYLELAQALNKAILCEMALL